MQTPELTERTYAIPLSLREFYRVEKMMDEGLLHRALCAVTTESFETNLNGHFGSNFHIRISASDSIGDIVAVLKDALSLTIFQLRERER